MRERPGLEWAFCRRAGLHSHYENARRDCASPRLFDRDREPWLHHDAARPRNRDRPSASRICASAGQGPEIAIGRVHPEFALRLEHAIREARSAGLTSAAIFSAYRPPAFGVGGFHDKFNSLHTYGLAVDMRGIGAPGSSEAQLWHEIAAKNGVVCPYGPRDRAAWNHCQPTSIKTVRPENPLRETVTAAVRGRQFCDRGHGQRRRFTLQGCAHAGARAGNRCQERRAEKAGRGPSAKQERGARGCRARRCETGAARKTRARRCQINAARKTRARRGQTVAARKARARRVETTAAGKIKSSRPSHPCDRGQPPKRKI